MTTTKTLDQIMAPITVAFQQLATQLITIGSKGTVLYATKDTTLTTDFAVQTFNSALSLSITNATVKSNVQQMFNKGTSKVILFSYKTDLDSVSTQLDKLGFNYLVSDDAASQTTVELYAKEKGAFAVVFDIAADNMDIINCTNPTVTPSGGTTIPMVQYLPIVAGALAGVPYDKSASSVIFTDLDSVEMPEEMHDGEFLLYNEDDGVRVASSINSLVTLSENITADMQSICIVEGMKRLESDVKYAFRTQYKGHYKNDYDNQKLFFAALNYGYLTTLVNLRIIDPDYANTAGVDVDTQRLAWLADGKAEAETWTDAQVKNYAYKNIIFPLIDAKFLDAIEGMQMRVNMY